MLKVVWIFSFYLTILTSCKPVPQTIGLILPNSESIIADTFGLNYIMGKFEPAKHPDFVVIPSKYRDETVRYLRRDVMIKFAEMADAAAEEGVRLIIRSATRNFDSQKQIWENKWKGLTILEDGSKATEIKDEFLRAQKILLYSSMPGTSRHHWGTDVDINSFENSWFAGGEGARLYAWMESNASQYGFCQVYGPINSFRKHGYQEEKWHWSYLPIAQRIQEEAAKKMNNKMISGFDGSHKAMTIDMVKVYMLSIDPACM
ncbi:MAG: M15 family metallopeptidase [Saprospiraceae bacterium]|nr:M15 family metallopeptidase [Saprospiraceae bacterium]